MSDKSNLESTVTGPIFRAFRAFRASESLAYTATEGIRSLAGTNIITVVEARFQALRTELVIMRWLFGVVITMLMALMALVLEARLSSRYLFPSQGSASSAAQVETAAPAGVKATPVAEAPAE